jgi:CheY-like chemotaxis protein
VNAAGTILLVEDDPTDVLLLERSFRQTEVAQEILVVQNGMEAIDFLTKAEISRQTTQQPLPRLIFLDLKLPLKSGLEVLSWIRSQATIKRIPVIVFTSSLDRGDIEGAYEFGASGYFLKTGSLETMRQLAVTWRDYWLTHAQSADDLSSK